MEICFDANKLFEQRLTRPVEFREIFQHTFFCHRYIMKIQDNCEKFLFS